jgi:hypothetical protein
MTEDQNQVPKRVKHKVRTFLRTKGWRTVRLLRNLEWQGMQANKWQLIGTHCEVCAQMRRSGISPFATGG